jgi:hypothetical protein
LSSKSPFQTSNTAFQTPKTPPNRAFRGQIDPWEAPARKDAKRPGTPEGRERQDALAPGTPEAPTRQDALAPSPPEPPTRQDALVPSVPETPARQDALVPSTPETPARQDALAPGASESPARQDALALALRAIVDLSIGYGLCPQGSVPQSQSLLFSQSCLLSHSLLG